MLIICIVFPLVLYVSIEVQNSILTGRNIAKAKVIIRAILWIFAIKNRDKNLSGVTL